MLRSECRVLSTQKCCKSLILFMFGLFMFLYFTLTDEQRGVWLD